MLPAPFGAPLPSPLVREHSPREPRGWEIPAHPAPRENRGGGALAFLRAGCLKCEPDDRALNYERCRATCSLHPPLGGGGSAKHRAKRDASRGGVNSCAE